MATAILAALLAALLLTRAAAQTCSGFSSCSSCASDSYCDW